MSGTKMVSLMYLSVIMHALSRLSEDVQNVFKRADKENIGLKDGQFDEPECDNAHTHQIQRPKAA